MNQKELLKLGETKLNEINIGEAEIKAKILLEYVLQQSRQQFVINVNEEVSKEKEEQYKEKLEKLIQGKPLQYITHKQEFMGLDFYVDENVLIPQPDTEILVEQALKILNNETLKEIPFINSDNFQNQDKKVLDLCTGSGAIAISIAYYCKNIEIIATDISEKALEVARKNAKQNEVENQITFVKSDLFQDINITNFDIIVSNPPYIETAVIPTLSKEVQQEPKIALDGGKDGLFFYQKIIQNVSQYLKEDGYLLLEIGYDQGKKVLKLPEMIENTDVALVTKKPIQDLAGNDRVVIFQKRSIPAKKGNR